MTSPSASTANPNLNFYHTPIFKYFLDKYPQKFHQHYIDNPRQFCRTHLLSRLEKNCVLEGEEFWNLCNDYLLAVEQRLCSLLCGHSLAFWMHLYRRIAVALGADHPKTDPPTLRLVRQIVELAIYKYGAVATTPDDVGWTTALHPNQILGGHYQRLIKRWLKPKGEEEIRTHFARLRTNSQWVISRFLLADYFHMFEIEGLAYEYWRTTAIMRGVGKGLPYIYAGNVDWPEQRGSSTLLNLLKSYDSRTEAVPFSASLMGVWFQPGIKNLDFSRTLFVPVYNVYSEDGTEFLRLFDLHAVDYAGDPFTLNFLARSFDIQAFRDAHQFAGESFEAHYGISLDGYLITLWALSHIATFPPELFAAMSTDADLKAVRYAISRQFLNLLQRGYTIFKLPSEQLIDEVNIRIKLFKGSMASFSEEDLRKCLSLLTVSKEGQERIGLWSGGPRFVIVPLANATIIDLQGIPWLLQNLFVRMRHAQTERGGVFEKGFREALTRLGFQLDQIGIIRNNTGQEREIDASVRIDDHLILFECRTIELPLIYELGKPTVLGERRRRLDEKVIQALSLREFIMGEPAGRNYDFRWARQISVFVVSPFVEWIWERSERLWHDATTPRILQVNEALDWLRRLRGPA